MKKGASLLSVICLFLACTNGIYPQLGRPLADPVVNSPEVKSFSRERTILISWESDACADEYILYRRSDSVSSSDKIIYRGKNLEYSDTDGSSQQRYLYSLSKIRGSREFGPSSPVFGLFADTIEDFSEPNDTRKKAVLLESDLEANSYYYRNLSGNIITDEDWYYLEIQPRKVAYIVLDQTGLDAEDSFFNFSQEGEVPFRIANNNDIPVENYSYKTVKIYFKVYPVASEFLADITQPGGCVVGYTLSLHMIQAL